MLEHASVEQKLELIRTMRSEHNQNMDKLKRRKEIIHPEYNYYPSNDTKLENYASETKDTKMESNRFSSFKLRLIICIALFLLFFYMDVNHHQFYSITSEHIVKEIESTLPLNSIDFINQLSYTLTDIKK